MPEFFIIYFMFTKSNCIHCRLQYLIYSGKKTGQRTDEQRHLHQHSLCLDENVTVSGIQNGVTDEFLCHRDGLIHRHTQV